MLFYADAWRNEDLKMKRIFALICALTMVLSLNISVNAEYDDNLRDAPENINLLNDIEQRTGIAADFKWVTNTEHYYENGEYDFDYEWYRKMPPVDPGANDDPISSHYTVRMTDGMITYFDFYDNTPYDARKNRLGKILPSDYPKTAHAVFEKANPGFSGKYYFTDYYVSGNNVVATLIPVINGKRLSYDKDSLSFDKNTGVLTELRLPSVNLTDEEIAEIDIYKTPVNKVTKTRISDWLAYSDNPPMPRLYNATFTDVSDSVLKNRVSLLWANDCIINPWETNGNKITLNLSRNFTVNEWVEFIEWNLPGKISSLNDVNFGYMYFPPSRSDDEDEEEFYNKTIEYLDWGSLTREEAVRYFAEAAVGNRISRYSRIYDDFYPDIKADDDLAAAITVCVAEGLLVPDGEDFDGDKKLSFEDAINWMYNFYSQES
jgi:hypothetical protein